jgi:hypothetical protein
MSTDIHALSGILTHGLSILVIKASDCTAAGTLKDMKLKELEVKNCIVVSPH